MKKSTRFSFAMLVSAAALTAALSAPAVFAEEGHGDRHGRGSDDVATTVAAQSPAMTVADNDINDDRGVDAPAAPGVDVRHDDPQDND